MRKREIACNKQLLLFSQYFRKTLKTVVWESKQIVNVQHCQGVFTAPFSQSLSNI